MKKTGLLLILSLSALIILSGCRTQKKPAAQGSADTSSVTSSQKSKKATAATSSSASDADSSSTSGVAESASNSSTDVDSQTQENTTTVDENRAATNHIASADSYAYSAAEVQTAMTGQPTTITQPTVFLTFDDGVNQTMTPRVLQVLADQQVHATFFVVGNTLTAPDNQAMLQKEYQAGHGIAIHSYDHNYSLLYPNRVANAANIVREYQQAETLMQQILGADFTTKVWRYPGGHMSWQGLAPADAQLKQLGVTWMDWNGAVGDALGSRGPKTVEAMLQYHANSLTAFPSSPVKVILMHDAIDKELTLQALPKVIEYYKTHGYQFGILS
ncbi:polysaccharide deacetylase family protein [Lapidilactobacillus wuchangensis]|uniref:polysaccharide deacetylase family protein n=1 Tax=Lapidilactobacillus wuchangensis TaxID=2486001 RepID=UPI0013DE4F3A|nr:polysaccharide deacetylase family protein [Lapidilactobacillus wuchangensis]